MRKKKYTIGRGRGEETVFGCNTFASEQKDLRRAMRILDEEVNGRS